MKLSIWSDLEFEVVASPNGEIHEVFENKTTGYGSIWNAKTATDAAGHEGHTGSMFSAGDATKEVPIAPALTDFRRFLPPETYPWTPLAPGELHDTVPWTHTTGPGNRRYIAPALRYALSSNPVRAQQGRTALRAFSDEQRLRPLSHVPPFDVRESLYINQSDPPNAWHCDRKTSTGRNAWDPAHNCLSIEFASAMLGQDEGLVAFFMQYRILAKGHPAKTSFWFNQKRAAAWSLLCDWYATWLGFTPEAVAFMGGVSPKDSLKARIDHYCTQLAFDHRSSGTARAMPQVGNFTFNGVNYGNQCDPEYTWQWGILISALALVCSDNVLAPNSPQRAAATDYARKAINYLVTFLDPTHGLPWEINRTTMPLDAAKDLHAKCDVIQPPGPSRHPYTELPFGQGFVVAGVPMTMDLALQAIGWLLTLGKSDPRYAALARLLPKPGVNTYEPQLLDMVAALS